MIHFGKRKTAEAFSASPADSDFIERASEWAETKLPAAEVTALRALVPTVPGRYVDNQGEFWELQDGMFTDNKGSRHEAKHLWLVVRAGARFTLVDGSV